MKRWLTVRKSIVVALLSGGLLYQNGCLNALLSIQVCGVILPPTICTPTDQLLLTFPFLEVPDFRADPTCTIPNGCFTRDDVTDGSFPFGGGPPVPPQNNTGGGGGGGGGGGI